MDDFLRVKLKAMLRKSGGGVHDSWPRQTPITPQIGGGKGRGVRYLNTQRSFMKP